MISSWMLYAGAVSILITIAAVASERGFAARGLPTRFVWSAAMVLSVLWPIGPIARRLLPARAPVSVLPFTIVVQGPTAIAETPLGVRLALLAERGLVVLWIVFSLALLLRLVRGIIALRRMRSQWRRGRIDGVAVRFSDNVGPAVVGLRMMDVVLPEWIFSLDAPLRAIVLRHEEEHRHARDPYLLFGAAVLVTTMPWNALLWLQARRLRLAIEMDCDARVLRVHPSPERYGMLMLTIAQRRSLSPAVFAPMLTEPTTQLERRILAMRRTTRRLARLTMYAGGAVAALMLAFATSLQSAGVPIREQVLRAVTPALRSMHPAGNPATRPVRSGIALSNEVRKLPAIVATAAPVAPVAPVAQQGNPAPRYPDMLRSANVEGSALVRFYTDANGVPDMSTLAVVKSSHQLFTDAVKAVLPKWHLAKNSAVEMPFVWLLAVPQGSRAAEVDGVSTANAIIITAPRYRTGEVFGATPAPEPASPNQTYFEFQVERQAKPLADNPAARYPDLLREAGIEGAVLAQFVLNPDGSPDMDTFKVLKSTHDLFTESVKATLPSMRFEPATVGGKAVRQLIQMPFQFSLSKDSKPPR
jgi:TonB family protein